MKKRKYINLKEYVKLIKSRRDFLMGQKMMHYFSTFNHNFIPNKNV